MQTFSKALIELVVGEKVDREIAANAAPNRHDFLIALDRTIKEQTAAAHLDSVTDDAEDDPEPEEVADEVTEVDQGLPRLRVAGQS
jgi:hypothetical protein